MIRGGLDTQLDFLRARSAAAQSHSFSTLLEHLTGTRELLCAWRACPDLCAAGLFHSVYGTESFGPVSIGLAEREAVRGVIGAAAEEIVYLFSVMTAESFEANLRLESGFSVQERTSKTHVGIAPPMFRHLCNLSAANWLEQRDRLPRQFQSLGRERYRSMLKFVLPAAADALTAAYDFS